MKLPTHVDFGPFRAKITLVPGLESDGDVHGSYTFESHPEIKVGRWGDMESGSVLIHEILHFMSDCAGLKLKESDVRRIEFSLACLFKDNPDVVLSILEALTSGEHRHDSSRNSSLGTDDAASPHGDVDWGIPGEFGTGSGAVEARDVGASGRSVRR